MKKKVLYIIYDANFGGGSRHLFDLITNLDSKNFETVLISKPSPIIDKLSDKFTVYPVEMKTRIDKKSIKKIQEIIIKEKPDIIHLHSTRAGILGTIAAKKTNIPVVYTEHLFTKDYVPQNKLIHFAQIHTYKILQNNITKVIAVSESVKEYLVNKKIFSKEKIEIIYNGINLPKQIKKTKKKNQIIIGTIGALTPLKGQKYLLKAARIALDNDCDIKLEIVGYGNEKEKLELLARKLKIEKNIKFLGSVQNVKKTMQNWDIYAQSSFSESFGLATLEAMTNGLPIIATRVGATKEVVGKNGILIEPGNEKSLASAIIKLTKNKKIREFYSQKSVIQSKKFNIKKMIGKTQNLYLKLIK